MVVLLFGPSCVLEQALVPRDCPPTMNMDAYLCEWRCSKLSACGQQGPYSCLIGANPEDSSLLEQ